MENLDYDQWNVFVCDKCDQAVEVTPETSRLIFYQTTDYALFMGECTNDDCRTGNYRFVPMAKMAHFDFMDWREWHERPTKSVETAWDNMIGKSIDKTVGEFALKLEHVYPIDF